MDYKCPSCGELCNVYKDGLNVIRGKAHCNRCAIKHYQDMEERNMNENEENDTGRVGMIKLTVTGDTYPMRKVLDTLRFQYNHSNRWYRAVKETDLNRLLDRLRPRYHYGYDSPEIHVKLESVDNNGHLNREGVVRITLTSEGAKAGVDYLEIFKRKVCNQIITSDLNESPASLDSGKDKKEW